MANTAADNSLQARPPGKHLALLRAHTAKRLKLLRVWREADEADAAEAWKQLKIATRQTRTVNRFSARECGYHVHVRLRSSRPRGAGRPARRSATSRPTSTSSRGDPDKPPGYRPAPPLGVTG